MDLYDTTKQGTATDKRWFFKMKYVSCFYHFIKNFVIDYVFIINCYVLPSQNNSENKHSAFCSFAMCWVH